MADPSAASRQGPMASTGRPESAAHGRPPRRSRHGGRWLIAAVVLVAAIVGSDIAGWFYLRQPIQAVLSSVSDREVRIGAPLRIHLLRPDATVSIGSIWMAAPSWSNEPHFVDLRGIDARLEWAALLGGQVHLRHVGLEGGDVRAIRQADGRATWTFGAPAEDEPDDGAAIPLPIVDSIDVGGLQVKVADAVTALEIGIDARTERDGDGQPALRADGDGQWQGQAFGFDVHVPRVLQVAGTGEARDLTVNGRIKSTTLNFEGEADDLFAADGIRGGIVVAGDSLGDLALVPGLVLPETPPFRLEAQLSRNAGHVEGRVTKADIGSSRMTAEFDYAGDDSPPMLRGRLDAAKLALQDLGPSIGTDPPAPPSDSVSSGDAARAAVGVQTARASPGPKPAQALQLYGQDAERSGDQASAPDPGPVLPERNFDLTALRAMNADFAFDLRELDLGTDTLRPLRSVQTQLALTDGVLKLNDLEAGLANGRVSGASTFDTTQPDEPRWDVDLDWKRVDLRQWIRAGEAFVVAGRFSGKTRFHGTGQSTATLFDTLNGSIRGRIDGGSISHLILEAVGLDVAQAIGVYFQGSTPLDLSCALLDIGIEKGRLNSNALVLNTKDTLLFVEGGVNFRDETLDARIVPAPKDWSPLSLRTPIRVSGTLGDPSIGLEPVPIGLKLLSGVVLGTVAPIAALIPFIDTSTEDVGEGCGPALQAIENRARETAGPVDGEEAARRQARDEQTRGPIPERPLGSRRP